MKAVLFDGKSVANTIEAGLKPQVENIIKQRGYPPGLLSILIGDDEASVYFTNLKQKRAEAVGMSFECKRYPETFDPKLVVKFIQEKNEDRHIDGIIVQLPLPSQFNRTQTLKAIHPYKDVDGLHPKNLGFLIEGEPHFVPPAVRAVEEVMKKWETENGKWKNYGNEKVEMSNEKRFIGEFLEGKEVVMVGAGLLIGKPVGMWFVNQGATVTLCNSKTIDLTAFTKRADIVIASTGEADIINAEMVKQDAVLIDFGGKKVDGVLKGEFNSNVYDKARMVTPVPGGVGPLTVAKLLENTVISAERSAGIVPAIA